MTLWASKEAAEAGVESGYYDEQVAKFVAMFRAPTGRDHYEIMYIEAPGTGKT
jgi:hypothetical protein